MWLTINLVHCFKPIAIISGRMRRLLPVVLVVSYCLLGADAKLKEDESSESEHYSEPEHGSEHGMDLGFEEVSTGTVPVPSYVRLYTTYRTVGTYLVS